jgi:hypothetical protein
LENIIQFKAKQKAPVPTRKPTSEELGELLEAWERGFALYIMATGLLEVAKTSPIITGEGAVEQMNHGIMLMAGADYKKMEKIVTNPLLISQAFVGAEALHAELKTDAD